MEGPYPRHSLDTTTSRVRWSPVEISILLTSSGVPRANTTGSSGSIGFKTPTAPIEATTSSPTSMALSTVSSVVVVSVVSRSVRRRSRRSSSPDGTLDVARRAYVCARYRVDVVVLEPVSIAPETLVGVDPVSTTRRSGSWCARSPGTLRVDWTHRVDCI